MVAYITVALILLISAGVYLYFYFLRTADFWGLKRNSKKIRSLAIFFALCLCFISINPFGFGALVVLHLVGTALCLEVINFLYRRFHRQYRSVKIGLWNKIFCSGLAPVIITVSILGYGYYDMENVKETDYIIHTGKTIRSQGYKIAMLADLHFGTTMDEEKLKKYSREIEEKKPDLVVLCGDIVDSRTTQAQMENAFNILGHIKSSFGTFYVYGNHDKSTYGSGRNFSAEQLNSALISNGIHVLEDQIYSINDEFTIIGRKDRGFHSENGRENLGELAKDVNCQNFLLLLDHQPRDFQEASSLGIDLQLSGHTHGGQIWPESLFNVSTGVGELNYGYEKLNNFQTIVTSGIGGYGYPIRTGSHSEYVIVDVKK